jgi:hypothetical protein
MDWATPEKAAAGNDPHRNATVISHHDSLSYRSAHQTKREHKVVGRRAINMHAKIPTKVSIFLQSNINS